MLILEEVEEELRSLRRKSYPHPNDQGVLVFQYDAYDDFVADLTPQHRMFYGVSGVKEVHQYKGFVVALTRDTTRPRVAAYTRIS